MAKNLNCKDLGAEDCAFSVTSDSLDEVADFTLQHARHFHGMSNATEPELAQTLQHYKNSAIDV